MSDSLAGRITESIGHAMSLYHRLVLLVAPSNSGKTAALKEVRARTEAPLINVNLDLSRQMLDLTERQRALQLPRILEKNVSQGGGDLVLLDNIEMLFDLSLKQDPLRLLQGMSRRVTVVAAWNGKVEAGCLTYAAPEHPEYRKYQKPHDFLLVEPRIEEDRSAPIQKEPSK